jgi:hypothetical protein
MQMNPYRTHLRRGPRSRADGRALEPHADAISPRARGSPLFTDRVPAQESTRRSPNASDIRHASDSVKMQSLVARELHDADDVADEHVLRERGNRDWCAPSVLYDQAPSRVLRVYRRVLSIQTRD